MWLQQGDEGMVILKGLGKHRLRALCGARGGTGGCYLWKEMVGGKSAAASGVLLQPCKWLNPEP